MKNNRHSWEDFLFENRNKAYGAYEIRTTADHTLLRALLVVVFTLGIIITAFSASEKDPPVVYDAQKPPPVYTLEKITPYVKPPARTQIQKKVAVTVKKKSGSDVVPEPVSNPKIEKPISKQIDLGIAKGPEDNGNPGEAGALNPGGIHSNGNGNGTQADENQIEVAVEPPIIYQPRTVTKMAVFPGCEGSGKTNRELTDCMSKKLNEELVSQLMDFEDIAKRNNLSEAISQLNFVVDKNGKITQIKAINKGNKELGDEARKALDRISKKLIKRGKYIKPAEREDGEAVNMIFSIPLRYQSK